MENDNKLSGLDRNQESAEEETSSQEGPSAEQEVAQLLEAKAQELKAQEDKYLRLAAEFENYKRLTQREQREAARFANENLLKELLPILDNLERAIQSGKNTTATAEISNGLLQGVELTLKQFLETVGRFGVRPLLSVGSPFDPACHQAVTRLESSTQPANTVVEEYQRGYVLHDRLLRAAMVAVTAPPEEQDLSREAADERGGPTGSDTTTDA